jgi:predicted nucleotidyltransferase
MRPSEALQDRVEAVRAIIARSPFANPRIFGSLARGEDDAESDLDLLVDATGRVSYFDIAALQLELEALLGIRVDVLLRGELKPSVAASVDRDLRPL